MSDHGPRPVALPSQTIGPFFHFAMGVDPALSRLAGPHVPGERVRLQIRVLDGDNVPVSDALIELMQADAEGTMPAPPALEPNAAPPDFIGFGRLGTSTEGLAVFETIRPGRIASPHGGFQAPHITVCVFSRGLLRHLYTRIYFAGDPDLGRDSVLMLVPPDRRGTLLAHADDGRTGLWTFDVRLQGDRETVFFDV